MVLAVSSLVAAGLIWLAISTFASVGFVVVMAAARRAEERERRRLAELHAAKELDNPIEVIGGGAARVPSDERWAA
jgi:membrane protein implicated in regulation of membrane protease activity